LCQFLDNRIPEELKVSLHQDLWRHRRNCARCSSTHKKGSPEFENTICVLEPLVKERFFPDNKRSSDDNSKKPTKPTKPTKVTVTVKTREEYLALEMVEMKYQLDDDFAAAEFEEEELVVWVKDESKTDMETCEKGMRAEGKDEKGELKYILQII
jgi:hypothetical protein